MVPEFDKFNGSSYLTGGHGGGCVKILILVTDQVLVRMPRSKRVSLEPPTDRNYSR